MTAASSPTPRFARHTVIVPIQGWQISGFAPLHRWQVAAAYPEACATICVQIKNVCDAGSSSHESGDGKRWDQGSLFNQRSRSPPIERQQPLMRSDKTEAHCPLPTLRECVRFLLRVQKTKRRKPAQKSRRPDDHTQAAPTRRGSGRGEPDATLADRSMRPDADITSRLKFADNQPPVIKAPQRARRSRPRGQKARQ
jgi:hypothetical protein